MMSAAQGGKFWAGFAAGALSSIASSAIQMGSTGINTDGTDRVTNFGATMNKPAIILATGAIMGGAGSAIGGGNFWQGAVTGLVVAGFNHLMHQTKSYVEMDDDQGGKQVTKKSLGITNKDNKETMINKMLKGMRIGDYIDGDDLDFIDENASYAIKNIVRLTNTDFKINRTFLGSAAISSNAKISLVSGVEISGNYTAKNGKLMSGTFKGVKVTTYGVPLQEVNGKYYNGYIINGNQAQISINKNIISWFQTK
jgi:hypothetical protein